MNMLNRTRGIAAALVLAATMPALGQTHPTTAPARTVKEVAAELEKKMLDDVVAFQHVYAPEKLTDTAARAASKLTVLPASRTCLSDLLRMGELKPQSARAYRGGVVFYSTIMAVYGDPDGAAWVDAMVKDEDPQTSLLGKGQALYVRWCQATGDAAAQSRVVDDAEVLAKANPSSPMLTHQISRLTDGGAADPALNDRIRKMITGTMKNAESTRVATAASLPERVGKPMVIAGSTPEGKPFTTADWTGKVVLVDFWAVWCGPCKRELPRVKSLYSKYHDQGLEVLGVSNDFAVKQLSDYTAANAMPWPELYDAHAASQQQWNPLTTGYGIQGIPCMFLVDKHGVCRSVTARESMEDLIPKLLAE